MQFTKTNSFVRFPMCKKIFFIPLLLMLYISSFAQDTLPQISVTKMGNKVLVSWINNFENVSVINIQRSYDSLKNFRTIGTVLNVSAKNNGFMDAQELPPPKYYRVFISFEGGKYLFSRVYRPVTDTGLNSNEVVEALENRDVKDTKGIKNVTPPEASRRFFVPSKHVYTGKENNVIISLPDAAQKKYSIKFFEEDGTPLFEIKKITEPYLTLDKVNFMHAGLFDFELFADGQLVEKYKLYIPKDGRPMPVLDNEGHELK
ncbi:MAG TPA: hypothetical protein VG847_09725 [Chitinophagaceae bacterium]|nr:hypothetical protein [Chitinophagaceae bacterium]